MSARARKKQPRDGGTDEPKPRKIRQKRVEATASAAALSAHWEPPSVVLSVRDKAKQLEVSRDQLVCVGSEVVAVVFHYASGPL